MTTTTRPRGLRGRPRPIRVGAATATAALVVFFAKTPVTDSFAIFPKALLPPMTQRYHVGLVTGRRDGMDRPFAHCNHLYRQAPVGSEEEDDDDMGKDWRDLKQSVKNIAKKAGKKLPSPLKEGAKAVKDGVKNLAKMISSDEGGRNESELIDDNYPLPRRRSATDQQQTDDFYARSELDSLGHGGLTDLFFGVPDYFSPRGPLVTRMFGGRDGLFSSDHLVEQDQMIDDVLEEARVALEEDSTAKTLLGEPMIVSGLYSQQSQTSTVNGKTTSTVDAEFGVRGPNGSGTSTVSALDGKVRSLSLDVGGRTHDIPVHQDWWRRKANKPKKGKQDILDAVVVDKR